LKRKGSLGWKEGLGREKVAGIIKKF